MQPEKIYQHLEELAEQLGISIRYEDLCDQEVSVRSGLCTVKGRNLYIMDRSKSTSEKIRLLSHCLCRMDLDGIYVLPAVREHLVAASKATHEK